MSVDTRTIDLATAVARIEAGLAGLSAPPHNWAKYHSEVAVLVEALKLELGAVFREGAGGVLKVRLCGHETGSTMGAAGALRNWLSWAKARQAGLADVRGR